MAVPTMGGGPGGRPGAGQRASTKVSATDVAQLAEHPVAGRRVLALFAPYRAPMLGVVAIIVVSALLGLASPFILRALIDRAIPQRDVHLLVVLVSAMLVITVVTQMLGVVQTYASTRIGQRVMHKLRTRLFTHLQRLPLGFFTRTRGGEVSSRITNDVNAMQSVVTDTATSIATNVTTTIGVAVAMVALSWRLSLISLVILPPSIYLTRRVARMRRAIQARAQRSLADMQTQIEESLSISGVQLAKTLGSGPMLSRRFEETSVQLTEQELASQMSGRWRIGTMAIIFSAIPAFIYLAAGLPATGQGMTIGTLVAFTALQTSLFRPVMGVLNVGIALTTSMALFSRVFEFLDEPVDIKDPVEIEDPGAAVTGTRGGPPLRGEVRLVGVSFRYPGSAVDALTAIDLTIPSGARVAVVGATGSGKSTLAALVSRLYDPTAGRVLIDACDVRDLPLAVVAGAVGVVAQDTYLLHASIAENLRYAKPAATDQELVEAARAAQVHEMILALPDGYDTVVGARGHRFSGGEKQRLALARTILRDPPILVLDEATSALDNTTERAVQRALDELSVGRTTLTIAHRLSTVRHADEIVVLDRGRVVQRGRHAELLAEGGRYAELVRAQEDGVDIGVAG